MSKSAFSRYAPFIQEFIYQKQWADLRQVQTEACDAILDTGKNVIIASGTASGKTEAAFFPILTQLQYYIGKSVAILYIGPLKALINDQFERLSELLEKEEIPVFPWHGDVSASIKKQALRQRKGIVQITPESLEAMLMRHPEMAADLFSDLRYVVIDEMHAFMGTDRGEQLRALLTRIQYLTGNIPRRIGLSATLADYEPAMKWLSEGTGEECVAAGLDQEKKRIALGMGTYVYDHPGHEDLQNSEWNEEEVDYTQARHQMIRKMYDLTKNKKAIIFTNRRSDAEEITADLKQMAKARHEEDVFYVHHGSVAAGYRRETEAAMKVPDKPAVICATNTLELGIDIGDLDLTIQYGAPYTVSSFVQRLGRSGRRSGKSQMFFTNLFGKKVDDPYARMPWTMLQSLAIILLYVEEKFIEPFEIKPKPYSLLAHQTLSLVFQHGEIRPRDLAKEIFQIPAFAGTISKEEYLELLRWMVSMEFLEQTEIKTLIPGLAGEKLGNFYTFYSVFKSDTEWQVFYRDLIGTVSDCQEPGSTLVLNGRTWRVLRVHEEKRKIFVEPFFEQTHTNWSGKGGEIHPKIYQKMHEILSSSQEYPLLKEEGKALLSEARTVAKRTGMLNGNFYRLSSHDFLIAPWCGTRTISTLIQLFKNGLAKPLEITDVEPAFYGVYVQTRMEAEEFIKACRELKVDLRDPLMVMKPGRVPETDAYDFMVEPDLLKKAFLSNQMDMKGAVHVLHHLEMVHSAGDKGNMDPAESESACVWSDNSSWIPIA